MKRSTLAVTLCALVLAISGGTSVRCAAAEIDMGEDLGVKVETSALTADQNRTWTLALEAIAPDSSLTPAKAKAFADQFRAAVEKGECLPDTATSFPLQTGPDSIALTRLGISLRLSQLRRDQLDRWRGIVLRAWVALGISPREAEVYGDAFVKAAQHSHLASEGFILRQMIERAKALDKQESVEVERDEAAVKDETEGWTVAPARTGIVIKDAGKARKAVTVRAPSKNAGEGGKAVTDRVVARTYRGFDKYK